MKPKFAARSILTGNLGTNLFSSLQSETDLKVIDKQSHSSLEYQDEINLCTLCDRAENDNDIVFV